MIKNVKLKYNCNCFFEYTNFKDDLIEYQCLCVTRIIKKGLMKT